MPNSSIAHEATLPKDVLNVDYNARGTVSATAFDRVMQRYRQESETACAALNGVRDVVYDPASGETLDIFGTREGEMRPLFLFVHGGYWRALSKYDSAFMAAMLARKGIATAVVDYSLAPAVSLTEIVRQVRSATAFLWREGARFGIDRKRIFAGGSSAGGHLTGTLLAAGWHDDYGVPVDVIKGAMPVSGLYHLAPIAQSFAQEWMSLTPQEVGALSPAEHIPSSGPPIVVAYAQGEPAGFRRQSREYHEMWLATGARSTLMEIPGRNHFDVILDLADPQSDLSKSLVALIEGKAG
ncbi:alpha/beta hydrolase [uncultured Nitratireductor sp.]|uniref:alpha/beta hydrolase n=1 Tax=uncultured Nitratireductor sp. TaxID=520953 RepID=UPI0025E076AF|nr:alpha/beta hydrolase [uncultured Nitratireductor sp.]